MRNDVRLRARTVSTSGALCDRFLESVFFTGNGRMGLRGCALFRPEPRPLDAGLFVAGIFDRLSGHTELTDFVALPSPRLEITLGGEKARPGLYLGIFTALNVCLLLILTPFASAVCL